MHYINFASLNERLPIIQKDFQSKRPFRYTMFENFFNELLANKVHQSYPTIKDGQWDGTTYIDQKNKFQKNVFDEGSLFSDVFKELNSPAFLTWLETVTGISRLLPDEELFGGGLHQSIKGAFLNVHVDYNIHPKTKHHRRLNVLVYMNKDWQDEYEGHLELWDMADGRKTMLAKYAPLFNRCVIFETNEISYHGHPKPLKTPDNINRKSIATYYYTAERPASEIAKEHNTVYVNTEGTLGLIKRIRSGIKAFFERL
jgi:Rps23 Pro-64 3,4-dihydroxylase Tpa1-like proline 4-hydroxylase